MTNEKKVVKKPVFRNGEWHVIIADGAGFFANELQDIPCGTSREAAYQVYRSTKKELGQGF